MGGNTPHVPCPYVPGSVGLFALLLLYLSRLLYLAFFSWFMLTVLAAFKYETSCNVPFQRKAELVVLVIYLDGQASRF